MSSLETSVEPIEGVENSAILRLEGALDQPTLSTFLTQLGAVRDRGKVRVLLDMRGVSYANSTALGALVTQADAFRDAGGELALLAPQPKVDLVIDMLGLKSLFRVFETVEEARQHLTASPAATPEPAASPAPTFPLRAECGGCKVLIEFPQAGRYRCPHCNSVYAVDGSGHIQRVQPEGGRAIELSLPCHPAALEALRHFIGALPTWESYSDLERSRLEAAVAEVCNTIRQKAYGGDEDALLHLLILSREDRLTLRFADHGEPLDASAFPVASGYMTEFDLRPHPARGNLLTMAKRAE